MRFVAWVVLCGFFYLIMRLIAWPYVFSENKAAYELALTIILFAVTVGMWIRPAVNRIVEPKEGDSRDTLKRRLG
jgi:hypothetical protein